MAAEKILIIVREDGTRAVKKNLDALAKSGGKLESVADDLKDAFKGLVTGRAIRDVVGLADNYANLMNRLRVVTTSQKELNTAMEGVAEMSRRTRSGLEANIDMYSRMAINTKDLGLEYKDVIKFADQVNKAVLLSGVTAREAQWGMVQFSQALASNALRGDELRAVLEQLPVVTDVIAKHFGVTRGELRQLGFEGRITAHEILKAFGNAGDELDTRFAKRLPTIDQAMTVLRGTVIKFVGTQDQMLQGTSDMARVLLLVSDNMDTLGRAAEYAGIVLALYFGAGLAIKIKSVTASLNSAIVKMAALHPLLFAFGAASLAVATYADKLTIVQDETATLADLFVAFKKKATSAAQTVGEYLASALSIDTSKIQSTFGVVIMSAAIAVDKIFGFFVGMRFALANLGVGIVNVFSDVWDFIIKGAENVSDISRATFKALGKVLKSVSLGITSAMSSNLRSFKEAAKGNFEGAAEHAKNAALAMKNAFGTDFGEVLANELETAFDDNSMGHLIINAEAQGENMAEAFGRGAAQSTMMVDGVKSMFDDAQAIADKRGEGEMAMPGLATGMTPQELELYKDLTGGVQKTNQAIINLSNVGYKDLLLKIKLTATAMKNGNIEQAEYNAKMEDYKTSIMEYVDAEDELLTLKKHGIITNKEYAESLEEVKAKQTANIEAMAAGEVTADAFGRKLAELRMKGLESATDIGAGFKRGFGEVALEMTDFATAASDVVTGAFSGMEDALVSFVTTGKVDFRSMVNSILADLTRMIARMAAAKLFESMASSAGGPWGAIFGAVAGASNSGGGGRASGGPISAGSNYVVGENGPEPFKSGGQGRIVNDSARLTDGESAQPNVTVVVVDSMEKGLAALKSAEGKRIIVNTVGQNQDVINQGG